LFVVTFLDSCNFVFIFNFPFVLLKSFSVELEGFNLPPARQAAVRVKGAG